MTATTCAPCAEDHDHDDQPQCETCGACDPSHYCGGCDGGPMSLEDYEAHTDDDKRTCSDCGDVFECVSQIDWHECEAGVEQTHWDHELGPRYEDLTDEEKCAEYFVDGGDVPPPGYAEYERRELKRLEDRAARRGCTI